MDFNLDSARELFYLFHKHNKNACWTDLSHEEMSQWERFYKDIDKWSDKLEERIADGFKSELDNCYEQGWDDCKQQAENAIRDLQR